MHPIEMHEMTPDFLECWVAARKHLDHQTQDGITHWIKSQPRPPFLEHMSFRLGNQLFFVRVEDESGRLEGPGGRHGLLAVARRWQGHACLLQMRRERFGQGWCAAVAGWGLLDAETMEPLDPLALVTDELIEMTYAEKHDMAVQVVRTFLQEQQYTLTNWHGHPHVDPSVWFVGDSEEMEWVVVRVTTYPDNPASRPEHWQDITDHCSHLSRTGHFAPVTLVSAAQSFASPDEPIVPLWRGHAMLVRFNGLE